jgi:hypothetical protein
MPITVGPFYLTHPVNFPCGRKPEYPGKTHDFRQSVDFYSFHIMYYLKHEQECKATAESFISDKARTTSVLNGLKNDPSYEFISDVILKINVV